MKTRETGSLPQRLHELNAKKIMLMLPDGLKPHVFDLFKQLSSEFSVIISSDAFYGACDIGNSDLYNGVDAIVQFGHSEIPNIKYPKPVIFEEYRTEYEYDLDDSVYSPLKESGYRNVGLLASIQYIEVMWKVKEHLSKLGFNAVVGKQDSRMKYPGQVLGCNFSAAHSIATEVDCYLVVSTGRFHAIGSQLASDKESFILDLNERKISSMKSDTERFLRKRYAKISLALNAKKFAIIVDTKIGQYRKRIAEVVASQLTSLDKEFVIMYSDGFNPLDIINSGSEAVIFTGCPRVSIDDYDRFAFPVLTPVEFQTLFGFKKTRGYVLDEIVGVDSLN